MEWTAGGGLDDDRTCEDYDPAVEWSHADDIDTVTISLPAGFKKEELRVQVDSLGYLRVHGQRPAAAGGSSNWIRVQTRFKLPDNCDIDGIRSKFVDDTLTVTLPKKKSLPSPPDDGSAPEPQEENEDEDAEEEQQEGEEEMVGEVEKPGGTMRPIRWLLATVAAVFFVGITGYVVWRKLRSGCAVAGAGDHGLEELVGAASYVKEM